MAQSSAARWWLVFFNLFSFFGWSMILTTLVKYMVFRGPQTHISLPIEFSEKLLGPLRTLRVYTMTTFRSNKSIPPFLATILDRASTFHGHGGALVALVQSLAVFEVVHALLGLVKTPVPTTVIQVASRLWLVWGISEQSEKASVTPWYASMVFAWAVTECVRYPFYANALMGSESPFLQWARYTFFYVLYPLGAGSEAMLMFKTLPNVWPWQQQTVGGVLSVHDKWTPRDYGVLVLFVLWWPGLYIMYTHMIRQRRRALGTKKLSVEAKRIAEQRKKGAQAIADGTWATGESSGAAKKSK